jgi:hypothetical protein
MVFIARAVTRGGRVWALCAAVVAAMTIFLIGFETVPAIGGFAVLCPLAIASGSWRDRLRASGRIGTCVVAGLVFGMALRVLHVAWALDGFDAARAELSGALAYRAATAYPQRYWSRAYVPELLHRVWVYWHPHLLVLVAAAVLGRGLAGRWRGLAVLAAIFLGEVSWFFLLRQHSHQHTHTVYHVAFAASLAVALAVVGAWDRGPGGRWRRGVLAAGVAAAAIVSWSGYTVSAYGNLVPEFHLDARERQIAELSRLVPPGAPIILDLGATEPSPGYFLDRPFVRRPGALQLQWPSGISPYVITSPEYASAQFAEALGRFALVRRTAEYALLDVARPPMLLNELVAGAKWLALASWGETMAAMELVPGAAASRVARHEFLLAPGTEATVRWRVTLPEWTVGVTDGATLRFVLAVRDGVPRVLAERPIDPHEVSASAAWLDVGVRIPPRSAVATLAAEVDCGAAGKCDADRVWLAPYAVAAAKGEP